MNLTLATYKTTISIPYLSSFVWIITWVDQFSKSKGNSILISKKTRQQRLLSFLYAQKMWTQLESCQISIFLVLCCWNLSSRYWGKGEYRLLVLSSTVVFLGQLFSSVRRKKVLVMAWANSKLKIVGSKGQNRFERWKNLDDEIWNLFS